ncbi:MAG: hypothetical protein COS65_21295 [Armatimonadetes bacterium CG06_land_8_20_14_3_00_66_21]|nr:MAG: hypothetical protein COS65_21295 [Armatimonadetes bacterium CG06_land_8_20_14_3_00_66_21]PIX45272.1 MAG: hypothetical protein COZ57_15920 [Armatimonadetes bacterium CG_4_8_14_3_um_filter_66_20]
MNHRSAVSSESLTAWLHLCAEASRRAVARGETPHLTAEETVGYVERTLPLDRRAELLDHLAGCPECNKAANAATRARTWSVTLVCDGQGLAAARTVGLSWDRLPLGANSEEGCEAGPGGPFLAHRTQGDWTVDLTASSADPNHADLCLRVTAAGTGTPVPNVPVSVDRLENWNYVRLADLVTDADGCVTFSVSRGEFAVRVPTNPALQVLVSVLEAEELQEEGESGNLSLVAGE